ncbi:MAG: hypothetical protein C5B50_27500 [Verrucomicrobia bacterium]|nr:MAG: hypothetical protein C5B50_27500 [Verrucomicrobiota bacterium]
MSGHWSRILPYVFMFVAALSRWPGLLPQNFSAFYGLAFCAGAFFPTRLKWWLPLGTLVLTDIALDFYYQSVSPWQLVNYLAYGAIILIGTRFNHRSPFLGLLAGGLLGAILFYLITNTASWLGEPKYAKDLSGWITALTRGLPGYPTTIEFFRNTLLSGGLFTGLFAGAMKLTEPEPAEEEEAEEEAAEEPEPEAGEAEAGA